MDEENSKIGTRVTLPLSDTVPGPGSYTVRVLNMKGDGLPVVDAIDLIETTGAGTANDVGSSLQAPFPGVPGVNAIGEDDDDNRE